MRIASTQVFEFDQVYDLTDLARIIGAKIGGKFVADTPDEPLNGFLTQQIDTMQDGSVKAYVTVHFYGEDEVPVVVEPTTADDDELTKESKKKMRLVAHSNPYKKLQLTKTREAGVVSELSRIKSGKLKAKKHDDAVEEAIAGESKRRKDELKKSSGKTLQKPSIPLD